MQAVNVRAISSLEATMQNLQNKFSMEDTLAGFTLHKHKEPRLTVGTLMWMGFCTGMLLCGFVLFMH